MMTFGQKNQKSFIFSSPLLTPWSLMVLLRISVVRFWNLCFAGFSSLCHFWCGGSSGSRGVAVGADHMGSIPRETGSPRTSAWQNHSSFHTSLLLLLPFLCVYLSPIKKKKRIKKRQKSFEGLNILELSLPFVFIQKSLCSLKMAITWI